LKKNDRTGKRIYALVRGKRHAQILYMDTMETDSEAGVEDGSQ
jgi:hypothetical protein